MNWVSAVQQLRRERRPGVLVTITDVRGHAPRDAGAKMVVSQSSVSGTIGGGNLEETALLRAREMVDALPAEPWSMTVPLTDKARSEHGRQCCGGEVTLLFEPLPVVPSVAIFGMGHVGLELARILARHDLDLHLVDSRQSYLADDRLACLEDGLGTIGLIGSAAKWRRFQQGLRVEGHPESEIARIQSPIGSPEISGKEPAVIALSVAADLLRTVRVGASQ
jgi:xanthine dehydrogenase accessory factor